MGNVNITLANGQLGLTLQTNDGITGLVVTGTSEGGYTTGNPILITSLAGAEAEGITTTGNPFAWRQVREYYDQAGTGAQLYLMLVPPTMTVVQMADYTNVNGVKKLLDYAGGKIKVVGLVSDDVAIDGAGGTITIAAGLNADVYTAVARMDDTANNYFNAHKPFRAVIGGTSYTGVAADLTDLTLGTTSNRTSILIGDTVSGAGACVGLALGTIASVPVQRKISRVRTGPISAVTAFVGVNSIESVEDSLSAIAERGFITFTKYANTSGYFFSGDPTCTAPTDDYAMLARGRVIDKAHILAYTTFVQVVDDEVPVNADGTLDAGFCKWLSQQMVNQVNNTMTANKEISSVTCFIDPAQNILSTNTLNVVLSIIPVGYATEINISLGFSNPANA
ncbi:MAG: hypothetical protein KF744_03075 [Taibaiella sp.]|nr:hypothetical protein [Taibaiella sp.]